jgi:hypothetical protein
MKKFVATVLLVLAVAGGARALHPPVDEPGTQSSSTQTSSTSSGGTVHITSVSSTPEPAGIVLALVGATGAFTLRWRRGRN